jgi:aminopeptidase C
MMRKLIFGVMVFCFMNYFMDMRPSKHKIKFKNKHFKRFYREKLISNKEYHTNYNNLSKQFFIKILIGE